MTSRDAELILADARGATGLLGPEIRKRRDALGLKQILLVEDLPIIAAAFGYTRRIFEPTYDEEALGASNLHIGGGEPEPSPVGPRTRGAFGRRGSARRR